MILGDQGGDTGVIRIEIRKYQVTGIPRRILYISTL